MNKPALCLLLIVFILSCSTLRGQKTNAVQFIEPNISITYDSTYLKVGSRYSNTVYETEAYDFTAMLDSSSEVSIHLQAGHSIGTPSVQAVDSILLLGMSQLKGVNDKDVKIVSVESAARHINGFSCIGFVGYDKKKKMYSVAIGGFHLSGNDRTEIKYTVTHTQDLENVYQALSSFLSGFRSYSKEEIDKEEQLIRTKYTVVVKPGPGTIEPYRPRTYAGIVSVEQPLEHKVAEVRLEMSSSSGWEVFRPDDQGQVPFICYDKGEGEVQRKGELVLFNSFGKKVKLPFTFTYTNRGVVR